MAKHTNTVADTGSKTISIINMVLLIIILVLGLTGKFIPENVAPAPTQNNYANPNDNAAPNPTPTPTPTPTPPAPAPTATASTDELEAFYDDSYIKGNEDAKVTVVEFSDFECPFCKRHSNQGTLEAVAEKYGDDVNIIFSHFPLNFHPLAQKAQEASECVGEQGGSDAFYAFKTALFEEPKPTREAIDKVAGSIEGIDVEAMNTCIDEGKYAQKVADAMNLGRKWGVTGTPGNIVIDNENGTLTKVSGAVPASAFDGPVTAILQ